MQRFQVPYNLKEIPEVQSYLTAQFDNSKNAGDLQDLYRRRYAVLHGEVSRFSTFYLSF